VLQSNATGRALDISGFIEKALVVYGRGILLVLVEKYVGIRGLGVMMALWIRYVPAEIPLLF
jgi:hypothetical protein